MLRHRQPVRDRVLRCKWLKSSAGRPLLYGVKTPFRHRSLRAARITLAGSAAMLLPFLAAADSQRQLGVTGESLRATAHVNFKIVIPTVLSLDLPSGAESGRGAPGAAIFSNNHTVTLAATIRSSEESRGTVVLSSAARKVIAQKVPCMPGSRSSAALATVARADHEVGADGLVCTACMP
jgi:hypothetical protein